MITEAPVADSMTVRDATWLHFHKCHECGHTWGCISQTCLVVHGVIPPGSRPGTVKVSLRLQIQGQCRRHPRA